MAIIRCPFQVLPPGHLSRPMLPVRIINPATNLYLDAWALIDTGADDRLDCILLGVNSFLSRFVLRIDYPKQVLSIRTP